MKLTEIVTALKNVEALGGAVYYGRVKAEQPLPFLVVFRESAQGFAADNNNILQGETELADIRLELYQQRRSVELEAEIMQALNELEIYFTISESIEQDNYILISYSFTELLEN